MQEAFFLIVNSSYGVGRSYSRRVASRSSVRDAASDVSLHSGPHHFRNETSYAGYNLKFSMYHWSPSRLIEVCLTEYG